MLVASYILPKNNLNAQSIFPDLNNKSSIEEVIDEIQIENSTFLGNEKRNFYGKVAPNNLEIKWKIPLGGGNTFVYSEMKTWYGSGWTGQPLVIKEKDKLFLIQGAYDHNLKKINAETGEIIWQYKFDDVIKGTGTIWKNENANSLEESILIIQGSRRGNNKSLSSDIVPSLRTISYFTGEELWRLNVERTDSYSRDVDGSGLIIDDLLYIPLENGLFAVLDPNPENTEEINGYNYPKVLEEHLLYEEEDIAKHGGNLVAESSVSRIANHLYVAAGSGHVYGYNLETRKIDWRFDIGSDIDGSAIVTNDNCLLISVEKQYIDGKGGIFKLDPSKKPEESVVWYFPTENRSLSNWEGGVIGSCAVNDYSKREDYPSIAAFTAIDGNLYVVEHDSIDYNKGKVLGPDNKTKYYTPELLFKENVGGSISTPLITDNKLIAAGYGGIFLYKFDKSMNFELLDHYSSSFESTPVVANEKIFVGSRDGSMYCFGN